LRVIACLERRRPRLWYRFGSRHPTTLSRKLRSTVKLEWKKIIFALPCFFQRVCRGGGHATRWEWPKRKTTPPRRRCHLKLLPLNRSLRLTRPVRPRKARINHTWAPAPHPTRDGPITQRAQSLKQYRARRPTGPRSPAIPRSTQGPSHATGAAATAAGTRTLGARPPAFRLKGATRWRATWRHRRACRSTLVGNAAVAVVAMCIIVGGRD
jgi:hypothetical protein